MRNYENPISSRPSKACAGAHLERLVPGSSRNPPKLLALSLLASPALSCRNRMSPQTSPRGVEPIPAINPISTANALA